VVLEIGPLGLEVGLGEAGADLADGLVLLVLRVVARQQVAAVAALPLPPSQVAADDDQVEAVPAPVQVVLLDLEPLAGAP
jgi:hypothetical protein